MACRCPKRSRLVSPIYRGCLQIASHLVPLLFPCAVDDLLATLLLHIMRSRLACTLPTAAGGTNRHTPLRNTQVGTERSAVSGLVEVVSSGIGCMFVHTRRHPSCTLATRIAPRRLRLWHVSLDVRFDRGFHVKLAIGGPCPVLSCVRLLGPFTKVCCLE